MEYRRATLGDLESLWNANIAANPDDPRWPRWKAEYISYHLDGKAATFAVVDHGSPVGEGTLLFSPECGAVGGRTELADGASTANVNALRIRKEYEGQGHISALVRLMEQHAREHGIKRLTIGVEAREARNLAIYLHWGYREFITAATEDGELVLYYAKELNE
ncbi:MAG: GNAT family N-acetyltransferase [Christensenellaceae bacterium]|nr:GNAT family N-acetyltransferase [Christensenellaceae bacterium]